MSDGPYDRFAVQIGGGLDHPDHRSWVYISTVRGTAGTTDNLRHAHFFVSLEEALDAIRWVTEKYKTRVLDELLLPAFRVIHFRGVGVEGTNLIEAEKIGQVWPPLDIVASVGALDMNTNNEAEIVDEPVESMTKMRFEVEIDSKILARFEQRLRARGLQCKSSAEFLEAAIATAISDSDFPTPPPHGAASDSTTIMVTSGRVVVRKLPEDS